ncbi:MAG: CDP-alcohol phosphatidyltransferase family protein [Desulfobacterales bacterium]|nr:CDP-alcohol phosphatidyltransferase family protein [Desulfobacterales bacterium]
MALSVCFVEESPVRIWGLTPRRRIERVLAAAGVHKGVEDLSALHDGDAALILRADYLIDDRLVKYLAATPDTILQIGEGRERITIAAHVPARSASQILGYIEEKTERLPMPGLQVQTPETLAVSFQEKLRKFDPPFVLPVSEGKRRDLERWLFAWSYKGVTDLVTKWAWPIPARWGGAQCVHFGIRPNHVTVASLVLVILAGGLFACGLYGWGLLAGWLMTFLDTVDGKLARVTVTSSRFGHYFDHLIDLVHPPVWYILWGLGLEFSHPDGWGYSLSKVIWFIMIGYVAGRLVEGIFQWGLGRFGIFCWRPKDSYFRLVTARRNPNLILLTVSTLAGRPELGLLAVAFWTVLTSLLLLLRLMWAGYVRITQGPLKSWFMDVDRPLYRDSHAARLFTRRAAR